MSAKITIKHHPEMALCGTWRRPTDDENRCISDLYALMRCPACGTQDIIAKTRRQMDREGYVLPTWECPGRSCQMFGFLHLAGWKP